MSRIGAKAKRERSGVTPQELLRAIEAFGDHVSWWERDTVIHLAAALGVTPSRMPVGDAERMVNRLLARLATASQRYYGAPNLLTVGRPFSGRRVIVVGAGPSLEHAAPYLERWARSSIVIAANTSAQRVCRHVRPHVVLIVDPLDHSHQLEGVEADLVALSAACHPMTWHAAAKVGARAFITSGRFGINAVRPCAEWLSGGVSSSAAILAAHLGADEIVLAGVDLALAPDRRAFAAGMLPVERPDIPIVPTVGWDGEPREVRSDWRTQSLVLERLAMTHQGTVRLVNASLGGARIEGWEHVAPADLVVPEAGLTRPVIDPARGRTVTEGEALELCCQIVTACRAAIAARDAQQRGDAAELAAAAAVARDLIKYSVEEAAAAAEQFFAKTGLR